jgi:endoglucanase
MPTMRSVRHLTGVTAVLMLLATTPRAVATTEPPPLTASTTASAADTWQPPLSTRGRYIVDAKGNRFRLKSANWDGAQGSWSGSGSIDDPARHHAGQNSYVWRGTAWNRLLSSPGHTGPVDTVTTWRMLNTDHGDYVQSLRVRTRGDWDPGASKAACPDGLRLIGLSHTAGRGLCTDATAGDLRADGTAHTVVTDERYVPADGDWASGYTKFQCPSDHFLIGYSRRSSRVSAALCAPARAALGSTGRTVWFDRSDNRSVAAGGDFAYGDYKGQCAAGEYAAGIAFTTRLGSPAGFDALLCRSLP